MSTISAGTTTNTALTTTGDTTGSLVLQTNGTTTALTLNTSQALGVGTSPSYGTSGQVLTSGGSSAAPTWTTPSAGAMTLISTQTASSSASLSWTGLTTYNSYMLIFTSLVPASLDYVQVQLGEGATPTYLTSGYYAVGNYEQFSSAQNTFYKDSASTAGDMFNSSATIGTPTTAGQGVSGYCLFEGLNSGFKTRGQCVFTYLLGASANIGQHIASGMYPGDTTAKTAIRIQFSASNITAGTASLYGISS